MSEHYDFHYQPTGSGAISGQQVLQQTEDAINELGDYVNDNVGGAMDVAQQALETAQNAEQDAQTALDTANSFSSAIQSAQQDASTALSTAQTAQTTASNANNTAIQASQDASSAVTTANNASGQVSTLSGTVTALGQRVTTAEGNIGQNTSDITALTTRVGTAEDNITTLQNDVTIAQGNASSAMATAGQVKQQAFVFRYSSTALVDSSTNSNALLDNTDNLKVGDKVIDSSGVLFSITAIDTQNSTFTIGTALIDLAQDSDVVHKSGNETKSGELTLSDKLNSSDVVPIANNSYSSGSSSNQWNNIYSKNYYYNGVAWGLDKANTWSDNNIFSKNVDPASVTSVTDTTLAFYGLSNTIFLNTRGSSNRRSYGSFLFAGYGIVSGVDNYGQIQLLRSTDKRGDTNDGYIPDTSFKMWRVAPHSLIMDSMEAVRVTNDGTENSLKPITNNATDLGTSDNKWKTLNGVEPSSLSLPSDRSARIDISSYFTNTGTGDNNSYTVPANGYIYMDINDCVSLYMFSQTAGNLSNYGNSICRNVVGRVIGFLPVRKGDVFTSQWYTTATNVTLTSAYFIPCQGNV